MIICSTCSPLASLKGKCSNQIHKMLYVQQQQVSQIWKEMMEITTQDKQMTRRKWLVNSIGKNTDKSFQSIYLLRDVFIRKIKMPKIPSLNWENSWNSMMKGVVLEKLLGTRQDVKVGQDDAYMDY